MDSNEANAIGKAEIVSVLSEGCDERVILKENGRNKYHLNPYEFEHLFQRGSCTANVLNPRSFSVAKAFLGKFHELNYENLLEKQASRLRNLVQNEFDDPFDVFFAPSGSDLVYYPNIFQMMLNPGKRLLNIVSCPEELGSGSKFASETKFYANFNQFGEPTEKGALVDPDHVSEVVYLDARDDSGHILERSEAIRKLVRENPDAALVGSLVYGSKSGIKDDLNVIDAHSDVMWVVDLCQFRVDHTLIHELLAKGAMVMLTGSKFFQAPPFCAALLVPRMWSERLKEADASVVEPYGKLFSAYDVPWFMQNMRAKLPAKENKSLRLRMDIALDEMEAYSYWSTGQTDDIIQRWAMAVMARLEDSGTFTLMPDQLKTNMSIISFQVHVGGRNLKPRLIRPPTCCNRQASITSAKAAAFGICLLRSSTTARFMRLR